MKSVKSSDNCGIVTSEKCYEESLDPAVVISLVNDEKLTETTILWNSLSSTLVNLAKVQCFNSFFFRRILALYMLKKREEEIRQPLPHSAGGVDAQRCGSACCCGGIGRGCCC